MLHHSRIPTSTALLLWNRRPPKYCLNCPNMQYVFAPTCEPPGRYCNPTDHVIHKDRCSRFSPNIRTIQNILGTAKAALEGVVAVIKKRKGKCLFVHFCEFNRQISTETEYFNSCPGWTNTWRCYRISQWSTLMISQRTKLPASIFF
jgi:hypothetical protein